MRESYIFVEDIYHMGSIVIADICCIRPCTGSSVQKRLQISGSIEDIYHIRPCTGACAISSSQGRKCHVMRKRGGMQVVQSATVVVW